MTRALALRAAACWLALVTACASPPSHTTSDATTAQDRVPERKLALELRELHDLVPSAGLRFLVEGSPRKIWGHARLRSALSELLPESRLAGFAERTGVDLRELEHALIAGFDYGTLYLGRCGNACGPRARALFIERLAGRAIVNLTDTEPVAATVKGTLEGEPIALIDMGSVVGVASRDLTLSRVPIAFARGKLKKTPRALRGAALSTLPELGEARWVTFYAPGPFEGEWARGLRGLMASALALAVHVEPTDDDHLRVNLVMSGEFGTTGQAALDELSRAFEELATSTTGKLLGLDGARAVQGRFDPQYLTLSTELPLFPLVSGLRAAVIADVWEILGIPKPNSTSGRPEQ